MDQKGTNNMFRGRFYPTLEPSNRIKLPTQFRDVLKRLNDRELIGIRGLDGAVYLIPMKYWEEIEQKLKKLPNTQQNRMAMRLIYASLVNISIDKNFRITLPKELLELANIEHEVLLLGIGEKIELWNPQLFNEKMENYEDKVQDILNDTFLGSDLL